MTDNAGNGQSTEEEPSPKAATQPTTSESGHSLWDFLIVALVVVAVVGLTVFLAMHYARVGSVVQVLGVLGPVFAAVFGVSIGYAKGNSAGKATGKAQGKKEVKAELMPRINEIARKSTGLVDTLSHAATSPANSSRWLLQEDLSARPLELGPDNMQLKSRVASLQSFVEGL